ncbi:hypothetical protein BDV06DRAFT_221498 [Aspergillus oleicola]
MASNNQYFLGAGQRPFGLTGNALLGLLALSALAYPLFVKVYAQVHLYPTRPKNPIPSVAQGSPIRAAKSNPTAAKYTKTLKAKGLKNAPSTATGFSEADVKALG